MQNVTGNKVMAGRHGEVWVDDHYLGEIMEFKASVTLDKAEVKLIKHQAKAYKVTGYTAKGSIKFHKVDSYFLRKMNDKIKEGKQPIFTIVSKISDPDAAGEERIVIRDATFDELVLADWSVDKILEESYNFTFSEWDILDTATGE